MDSRKKDPCEKFISKTFGNLIVFCYSDGTIILHDFYKRRVIEMSPYMAKRFINFIEQCRRLNEACNKANNQLRQS